jgi:hypothetical protein
LEIPGVSLRTNGEAVGTGVLCGSNAMPGLTASDCATDNPSARGLHRSDRSSGVAPDACPFHSASRPCPEYSLGPQPTGAAPPAFCLDRIAGSQRWRPSSPLPYRPGGCCSPGQLRRTLASSKATRHRRQRNFGWPHSGRYPASTSSCPHAGWMKM